MAISKRNFIGLFITGGCAATLFTFLLNEFASPIFSSNPPSNKNISTRVIIENNTISIFIANDSDETIDLFSAELSITTNMNNLALSYYPEPTRIYKLSSSEPISYISQNNNILFKTDILQSIPPGNRDRIGFQINVPSENITSITGFLTDQNNNNYQFDKNK